MSTHSVAKKHWYGDVASHDLSKNIDTDMLGTCWIQNVQILLMYLRSSYNSRKHYVYQIKMEKLYILRHHSQIIYEYKLNIHRNFDSEHYCKNCILNLLIRPQSVWKESCRVFVRQRYKNQTIVIYEEEMKYCRASGRKSFLSNGTLRELWYVWQLNYYFYLRGSWVGHSNLPFCPSSYFMFDEKKW